MEAKVTGTLAGLFFQRFSQSCLCIHFTRDFGSAAAGRGSGIACCRPAASAASGRRRIAAGWRQQHGVAAVAVIHISVGGQADDRDKR